MTTDSRPDNDSGPLLGLGFSEGLGPLQEGATFQPFGWLDRNGMMSRVKGCGFEIPVYEQAIVRDMIQGAWCAGYYDADYTHDSAYAESRSSNCADEFLGPNVGVKAAGRRPVEP